jgi:hypothetical protein
MTRDESRPNGGDATWYGPCTQGVPFRFPSDFQKRLVIDANAVIKDLRWLVKKRLQPGARTDLQEALASGIIVGYAPPIIRTSVLKYLPAIAEELGVPLGQLESEWHAYEPLLHYVEPEPVDPGVFGTADLSRDPDDIPYLQLAIQLGADGVLTRDKDIVAMGREAAIGTAKLNTVVGLRDFTPATKGLDRLASAFPQPWGMSSDLPGSVVSGVALTIGRVLSPTTIEIARVETYVIGPPSKEAAERLAEAEAEWLRQQARAREQLRDALAQCPRTVATLALSVLAAATSPLSIDEIVIGMRAAGYRTASPRPHAYVSRKLRENQRVRRYVDGLYGLWGPHDLRARLQLLDKSIGRRRTR